MRSDKYKAMIEDVESLTNLNEALGKDENIDPKLYRIMITEVIKKTKEWKEGGSKIEYTSPPPNQNDGIPKITDEAIAEFPFLKVDFQAGLVPNEMNSEERITIREEIEGNGKATWTVGSNSRRDSGPDKNNGCPITIGRDLIKAVFRKTYGRPDSLNRNSMKKYCNSNRAGTRDARNVAAESKGAPAVNIFPFNKN
jgi:hypothetical protein